MGKMAACKICLRKGLIFRNTNVAGRGYYFGNIHDGEVLRGVVCSEVAEGSGSTVFIRAGSVKITFTIVFISRAV